VFIVYTYAETALENERERDHWGLHLYYTKKNKADDADLYLELK